VRRTNGRIRVGVGGWTFEPWRGGAFYPKGHPKARELDYASRKLTTIEISGTFYSTQSPPPGTSSPISSRAPRRRTRRLRRL